MGKTEKMSADYAKVANRLGKTTGASKGSKPAPKVKVTGRPTGGLKPDGFKIKIEKKFSTGKR